MITAEQLARRLGLSEVDAVQEVLDDCLSAAKAVASEVMGRSLDTATTYTEYHDAGAQEVYVHNPPIVAITSVEEGAWPKGANAASLVSTDDIIEDTDDGGRNFAMGKVECLHAFSGGKLDVKVVYVGGWTADTIPGDLRQAILELAGLYFNAPDRLYDLDARPDIPQELVNVFRRYSIRDSKRVA